jgi:hypothetical protein
MIVGRFVLARGTVGISEASTTLNPPMPWTRASRGSTTAPRSLARPIRQVPEACQLPTTWRVR